MTDLLVLLSSNILKVTYFKKDGFGGFSSELPDSIVKGSEILNVEKFSESFKSLLTESLPSGLRGSSISFMVNPDQVFLYFIPVGKNGQPVEDQIVAGAKEKLPAGVNMEDLYFSFQKIAPFIYQFVAISKVELEKYLTVSNNLNLPLKSVVPWVLLLPKLVNDNKPSIFISKDPNGNQTVALSELGGIYFAQTYEEEKNQKDLVQLVQQLSLYNRAAPIDRIYTINYDAFALGNVYQVLPLEVSEESDETKGYEAHLLYNKIMLENPSFLSCQINLLTLFPVPVVQKTGIQVGQTVAIVGPMVLLLLVGGFFFFRYSKDSLPETPDVLSETSESITVEEVEVPKESVVEEVVLEKGDLKIRVENGTNIVGLASKTRDYLQELGYEVLSVGDSERGNLVITTLNFKESKKEFEDLLSKDLEEEYTLKVEYELDEETEYDVLISVGVSE